MPKVQAITFRPLAGGKFRGSDNLLYKRKAAKSFHRRKQRAARIKSQRVESATRNDLLHAIPEPNGDLSCPHNQCGALYIKNEYQLGRVENCWRCHEDFMPAHQ